MNSKTAPTVVILGAGVNGSALARELLLNGISVWVIDKNDLSFGATSKSSRLIHGGLRYLEYGDFSLVSESLRERKALRKNAPHLVHPLRLYIPVKHRLSGIISAGLKFLGGSRIRLFGWILNKIGNRDRGLWLVRSGLWFYDRFASKGDFLKHQIFKLPGEDVPSVDPKQYRWLCAYSDGQILYPERWIVANFLDCESLARENNLEFRLWTYHHAEIRGDKLQIFSNDQNDTPVETVIPDMLINATGAWGDLTLGELKIPSKKLFGGTKGSHIITNQKELVEDLKGKGIYAETEDGRMVFVLPFEQSVLIGTTDIIFEDRPENAISTKEENDYLIELVNDLFPEVNLKTEDILMHYSGVRPLPHAVGGKTSSISREHHIETHDSAPFPMLTLVGGKLTTARSFGQLVADKCFKILNQTRKKSSLDRVIPGGENYPEDEFHLNEKINQLTQLTGYSKKQVEAVWLLAGTLTEEILNQIPDSTRKSLSGTDLPLEYVRYVIQKEWVTCLDDLVERRLMVLYHPDLSRESLSELAGLLVEENRLEESQVDKVIDQTVKHFQKFYGKTVS